MISNSFNFLARALMWLTLTASCILDLVVSTLWSFPWTLCWKRRLISHLNMFSLGNHQRWHSSTQKKNWLKLQNLKALSSVIVTWLEITPAAILSDQIKWRQTEACITGFRFWSNPVFTIPTTTNLLQVWANQPTKWKTCMKPSN